MTTERLLRRIGERAVVLDPQGGFDLPHSGDLPPIRVTPCEVSALLSEDLIAIDRGCVRRTAAGRLYLKRSLAAVPDDRFAAQHREIVVETRTREGLPVQANVAESPLAWLASRRDKAGKPMLTAAQVEAGRRLAVDHERGMTRERVTQSWDVSGVHGESRRDRLTVTEAATDARRRVGRALDAVGPDLSEVLVAVCCEEQGLEAVEKRLGWPARCGKVVLRLALDRLARHYGIAPAVSGAARAGLVHWGAADYRPTA